MKPLCAENRSQTTCRPDPPRTPGGTSRKALSHLTDTIRPASDGKEKQAPKNTRIRERTAAHTGNGTDPLSICPDKSPDLTKYYKRDEIRQGLHESEKENLNIT